MVQTVRVQTKKKKGKKKEKKISLENKATNSENVRLFLILFKAILLSLICFLTQVSFSFYKFYKSGQPNTSDDNIFELLSQTQHSVNSRKKAFISKEPFDARRLPLFDQ